MPWRGLLIITRSIIFVDIMMPRLDGYQTCALVKNNPAFKSIPVIMLSSKDGLFDKAKGRIVGVDQFLTKPFSKEELLGAIEGLCAGVRRSRTSTLTPPHEGRRLINVFGENHGTCSDRRRFADRNVQTHRHAGKAGHRGPRRPRTVRTAWPWLARKSPTQC